MSKLLERTWFKMLIGVAWFFVVYNMGVLGVLLGAASALIVLILAGAKAAGKFNWKHFKLFGYATVIMLTSSIVAPNGGWIYMMTHDVETESKSATSSDETSEDSDDDEYEETDYESSSVSSSSSEDDYDSDEEDDETTTSSSELISNDPAEYSDFDYNETARGESFMLKKQHIYGRVIQVMDDKDGGATLRIATIDENGTGTMYDGVYMVSVGKSEWKATRLLEDDMVNMYGTNMGLQTYSSTMGGKITVPCLIAKFYEITE